MTNWSFRKKHPGKQLGHRPSSRNPLGFRDIQGTGPVARPLDLSSCEANPHESWKRVLNQRQPLFHPGKKPRSSTYRTRRQWQIYDITMALHKPHLLSATNFVANSQRLHHSWPGILETVASERTACWLSLLVHAGDQASSGAAAWASGSIFRRLFGSGWRQSAPEDELLSWTFLPFSSFASSRLLLIPIGNRENWPAYIFRMENTDSLLHSVTK
ncbi:hypothetical protein GB937_003224 [Aspergillus fischeri]|nr:hypothetical protein GB937_003224 [Aspergillus fischeri]